MFGGDLRGIEQRLDYIEQLGVNALYLTPIFPASSTHRYDATSFDRVDPLLGGDEALRSLLAAAHSRGVRVLGDLTTNHTGNAHEWFVEALADPDALERELYYFDPSLPAGYESWLGIPSLPKLDWRSAELRRRMVGVTRRWLEAGLDGWRIDVANMTGRYKGIELTREVAQLIRGALTEDALLVAEHGYDYRRDLDGTGWHGAMNYAGFLRPVWSWLLGDDPPEELRRSFWGTARRRAPYRRRGDRRRDARVSRRPSVAVGAPLVDPARQPRHRTLSHRERLARAAARRRGAADDVAGSADGLRRRRARPRGRVGRGRAAHDALGRAGHLGQTAARASSVA